LNVPSRKSIPIKKILHSGGHIQVQGVKSALDSPVISRKMQGEMSATIFYYTGTGNSLWTARRVADELGNAELFSVAEYKDENKTINSEIVGLVFLCMSGVYRLQ